MPVRLGTNPIAWSNDDLRDLGSATPLETCLAEARLAGYAGIELGHKFPRRAEQLRPILAAHDLALVSGWYSASLLVQDANAEREAIRGHADLLRAMGCTVLIIAETSNAIHGARGTPLSRRPVLADGEWARFGDRLTELAEALADDGLMLAYHHHMGTIVQSGAEIDRLMASTGPALKLLLDSGHATFAGADPAALARRHRARIAHVHCKDVRPAVMAASHALDRSFLHAVVAGVFTVPGDGAVDFPAILSELPGYDGWLVVEAEQDPAIANPFAYAKAGHDALARHARQAGLLSEERRAPRPRG
ncbi:MAG: myo-inosose-2 dehydratase [Rhodospirillales bacterium]|nr:myo-inosose-2 dehydratase [Rhodospirillales bacterium]